MFHVLVELPKDGDLLDGEVWMDRAAITLPETESTLNIIARCVNGHHFVRSTDLCPQCGGAIQETFEYRQGDCVDCGCFCPDYALGCTSPSPITSEELKAAEDFVRRHR